MPTPTIRVAVDDFVASRDRVRPQSRRTYRAYLDPLVLSHGDRLVSRYNEKMANAVLDALDDDQRSAHTLANTRSLLRQFARYCVNQRWCRAEVALMELNRSGRPKPKHARMPRPEMIRELEAELAPFPALADPVYVMLRTGLRRGECLALTWDAIETDFSALAVTKNVRGNRKVGDPKTLSSWRTLPLSVPVAERLQRIQRASGYRSENWVFRHNNKLWHPATFAAKLRPFLAPRKLRIHDLRHYYASTALAAGVPMKVISEILGHSSIATTIDLYAHVMDDEDRKAMEAVATMYEVG